METTAYTVNQENSFKVKEDSFNFWKNLSLIIIFFVITPVALGTSLFSLISLVKAQDAETALNQQNTIAISQGEQSGAKVFASLPSTLPSVSGDVGTADARSELIRQYLASYDSPLTPYADDLVKAADKYGLDYRLTTAIAQQESNLCKKSPPGTHNCWGWGIHSKGTLGFDSYEQGIDEVSKGLKENYLDKGYTTAEEIMSKYTPQSNGSWAFGVNLFMDQLQ
jgi:hypothetical protein